MPGHFVEDFTPRPHAARTALPHQRGRSWAQKASCWVLRRDELFALIGFAPIFIRGRSFGASFLSRMARATMRGSGLLRALRAVLATPLFTGHWATVGHAGVKPRTPKHLLGHAHAFHHAPSHLLALAPQMHDLMLQKVWCASTMARKASRLVLISESGSSPAAGLPHERKDFGDKTQRPVPPFPAGVIAVVAKNDLVAEPFEHFRMLFGESRCPDRPRRSATGLEDHDMISRSGPRR